MAGCICLCAHFDHVGICNGEAETTVEFGDRVVPVCNPCASAIEAYELGNVEPRHLEAAAEGLRRWLVEDKQVFLATVLFHLDCGHVRPMNVQLDVGNELDCFSCEGPHRVVSIEELDEPTEYPLVDALRELRTTTDGPPA